MGVLIGFFGIIILFSENILINNENFFYALMILIGSTFYVIGGLMTLKISKKRNENVTLNREIKEISQSQKNAISKFCDEDIFLYNQIKNYLECR